MLSFNLAKNLVAVWPVHLNRPCSSKEPESTVTLVSGKAMFLNQATTNQSSTGQSKDIRKKALNFPPEMWFNFAGECGARPPVVNHFCFFSSQHFFFCCCPLSCNYLPCPSTRWSSLTMGPVRSWGSNHWEPREMKLYTSATRPTRRAR